MSLYPSITKVIDCIEPKYRFVPLESVYDEPLEIKWLVEDYIPKNSVGMLYGASGAGKSHIALDIAVCIANGIPWCKKKTEKGFVFIMAGEGHGGLNRRLKAIEKTRKIRIDKQKILLSERAIGIDTEDGFKEVVAAIDAQPTKPDFIIIDTLSRHIMKSSENSNEDMANFINKLEQLQRRYDATIMIVHHTLSQAKT